MTHRLSRILAVSATALAVIGGAGPADAAARPVTVLATAAVTSAAATQVEGFGAVWVLSDTEYANDPQVYTEITKIDETTDAVVARLNLGYDAVSANLYPTGFLAAGAGAVWVVDYNRNQLIQIDPTTATVRRRVPTGVSPDSVALAAGSVWVSHQHQAEVWRYDPMTLHVVARIAAGDATNYDSSLGVLSVGDNAVWVDDRFTGTVQRIDPATEHVTSVDVDPALSCGPLVFVPGGFWLDESLCGNSMYRYDDAARAVTVEVDLHCLFPIGYGHGALYVSYARRQNPDTGQCSRLLLGRFDPRSGAVRATRAAPAVGTVLPVDVGLWLGNVQFGSGRPGLVDTYHVASF